MSITTDAPARFPSAEVGAGPHPTHFPPHTLETAPAASRPALAATQQALGFLPNMFAALGESPVVLNAYGALDAALGQGTFTPAERQLILTAASATNGCAYCSAAHSTFAAGLRATPDAVAAARGTGHAADPRTEALVAFVHAVVRARGRVEHAVVDHFLAAGFTPAQAIEVVANVALKTVSNYVQGFADVPLDAALAPQRWEPNTVTAPV
ncbi:alkyl hydroperoxide reductase AhpD [Gemmatimonadetes bacterium T265]|nr:alkyl hydroperoxide reductase AhpD [Gemmatimonadetes bacterium T265]